VSFSRAGKRKRNGRRAVYAERSKSDSEFTRRVSRRHARIFRVTIYSRFLLPGRRSVGPRRRLGTSQAVSVCVFDPNNARLTTVFRADPLPRPIEVYAAENALTSCVTRTETRRDERRLLRRACYTYSRRERYREYPGLRFRGHEAKSDSSGKSSGEKTFARSEKRSGLTDEM